MLILGSKRLKKFQESIIRNKFKLISNRVLQNNQIYLLNKTNQIYILPIIKYIGNNSDLYSQMTSYGQKLIVISKNSDYDVESLNNFMKYYSVSVYDLVMQLINKQNLSDELIERIIYEVGLQERKILEKNLPENHEILQKITKYQSLSLQGGYSLLK